VVVSGEQYNIMTLDKLPTNHEIICHINFECLQANYQAGLGFSKVRLFKILRQGKEKRLILT